MDATLGVSTTSVTTSVPKDRVGTAERPYSPARVTQSQLVFPELTSLGQEEEAP